MNTRIRLNKSKSILAIITLITMSTTALTMTAQSISSEFPFESKYVSVIDANMHYIEAGSGDPILFLHGIPMSVYSWRNIIPHLSNSARCLGIDFMGFGKSDKPDIKYSYDDQYKYLEAFIDSLKLKNITLVMTDIGGIIGQKYARLHPENVKAMAFMETPLSDAITFQENGGMMQKMMFWMAGKEKLGYRMFVKKNMFVKMMSKLIKRKLSKEEKAIYAAPFDTERSRIPMFVLSNSFPRKGKNPRDGDMADYLNKNATWLTTSSHPKLILTSQPGMLMNKKVIKWVKENLQEFQIDHVGKSKHVIEEDLPNEIGEAIRKWYISL